MIGGMERSRLLSALAVMAQPSATEDEWLAALRDLGFSEGEAHRAISFIPIGLSRPILERLGVTDFSDVASIPLADGEWMSIQLPDQPEYMAALTAARDHYAIGCLPHDAFEAVALRSADIAAVSKALDQGADVRGATIATAFHDSKLAQHVIR